MAILRYLAPLSLAVASVLGADLPAITTKGSKFFFANGTQFFLKGIGYQQDSSAAGASTKKSTFVDPLADETRCKQDVPLLAQLGTNVIRTYAIDPTADHSACMKLLNDAGIYVISDLSEPNLSIDRSDPEWNIELFTRYQQVVDSLAKYPNVIGFFAGNEVSNQANNTGASAYVKAAVRDTKQYIKDKKYRWMGVGYAANDDKDIRDDLSSYFNCGDADESIDYFGYNIYSWCGESNFEDAGYNRFIEAFKTYSVPVFFAEYGCNLPSGAAARTFDETAALYTANMSDVVSGGIVYEYFQETNDYGLVKVSGGSASKLKDFSALAKQVNAADPKGVSKSSYSATNKAASCPSVNANWDADANLPPTPDNSTCQCMSKASSCVAASGLSSKKYADIFDYICGKDKTLCSGINGNTTSGEYGAYSMCADVDKLAYVLDAYYQKQDKAATACDFDGQAQTQTASGKMSDCAAEGASGSDGGDGGSGSSKKDKGNPAAVGAPMARIVIGDGVSVGVYLCTALLGAAFLLV